MAVLGAGGIVAYTFELFVIDAPIFANIRINILITITYIHMHIFSVDRGCRTA
jgi:hypothetical protein